MRTATICPTCSTYENALCILYNGDFLPNTGIEPLDSVEEALIKINDNLVPLTGVFPPNIDATYVGQLYVNTAAPTLYYAETVGNGSLDWVALGASTPVNTLGNTYTPTTVNLANIASSTTYLTHYTRVESQVYVQGYVAFTPIVTGNVELIIQIPIASVFVATTDLAGFGICLSDQAHASLNAHLATNQAILKSSGTASTSKTIHFNFTYTILP